MLWYCIFTVVMLNGPAPVMKSDFVAFSTEADCQKAKAQINSNPDNAAFAECFFKKQQSQQF